MTARPSAKPPSSGSLSIIPAAAAFDASLGKAALRVLCAREAHQRRARSLSDGYAIGWCYPCY